MNSRLLMTNQTGGMNMRSTSADDIKLEYQKLSDTEKLIKYAQDYGKSDLSNCFKTEESYYLKPEETDKDFPNLYKYHFPLFYQYEQELKRIFADFPNAELYALICAATAFKNAPHVMFLWERRKHYGLKEFSLNTHELMALPDDQRVQSLEMFLENSDVKKATKTIRNPYDNIKPNDGKGIPDDLRYTII